MRKKTVALMGLIIFILVSGCDNQKQKKDSNVVPAEYEKISANQLFKRAKKLYDAKDYEKSSELFNYAALKGHPFAYFRLAKVYSVAGKKEEAVQSLLNAVKVNMEHVKGNIEDTDLKSIRMDSRILALFPVQKSNPKEPMICRYAPGPEDQAQLEVTLKSDHSVMGTGSMTGASLNLQFARGKWSESGDEVKITLIFKGQSFGPQGKPVTEERNVILKRSELSRNTKACFEIESF